MFSGLSSDTSGTADVYHAAEDGKGGWTAATNLSQWDNHIIDAEMAIDFRVRLTSCGLPTPSTIACAQRTERGCLVNGSHPAPNTAWAVCRWQSTTKIAYIWHGAMPYPPKFATPRVSTVPGPNSSQSRR